MARKAASADSQAIGPTQVVERALNQTRPGFEEHELRRSRFNSAYDIYRGNAGQSQAVKANSWQSRLRVKYGMQVIDQALVNLVQGVPHAKVTPRRQEDEVGAIGMEKTLGYYADLDHLAEKEPIVAQQALVYGVSPAVNSWLYREVNGKVVDDRPTMIPWDAYAIWWDPTAYSVDTAGYIVLESFHTRDELERDRFNKDDGTGQWQNLDALFASGDDGKPDANAQNQMLPQPMGTYRGKYRIWRIWRQEANGMRLTVVGNRKILLKDGPGPYEMNSYPVTISNSRPDMFRIEGISETELVDHLQQAAWTVHNLRMESLKFSVMQGATVRATVPDISALVLRPGWQFVVNDHDDVQFHSPPPLQPEAYKETDTILELMQYVTGINQYTTGSGDNSSQTATTASLFTQAASRLLSFKAAIIHQRTWQRTFEQWGMLTKQFLKRDMAVRIIGPGGIPSWVLVGPEEVNGDFDIRIEAGDDDANKSQARADAVAFANVMIPYIQEKVVDPKPIVRQLAVAFNIPNPEALFMPAAPPPPVAAPGVPQLQPGQSATPPFTLGQNGGAVGINALRPHPPASLLAGNQT